MANLKKEKRKPKVSLIGSNQTPGKPGTPITLMEPSNVGYARNACQPRHPQLAKRTSLTSVLRPLVSPEGWAGAGVGIGMWMGGRDPLN